MPSSVGSASSEFWDKTEGGEDMLKPWKEAGFHVSRWLQNSARAPS